jgi:hypothetical protein
MHELMWAAISSPDAGLVGDLSHTAGRAPRIERIAIANL